MQEGDGDQDVEGAVQHPCNAYPFPGDHRSLTSSVPVIPFLAMFRFKQRHFKRITQFIIDFRVSVLSWKSSALPIAIHRYTHIHIRNRLHRTHNSR